MMPPPVSSFQAQTLQNGTGAVQRSARLIHSPVSGGFNPGGTHVAQRVT